MIKVGLVLKILSRLLILLSIFMVTSSFFSLYYRSSDLIPILISSGITFLSGFVLLLFTWKNKENPGQKEGFFIVTTGWVVISFFGALPFYISGEIPSFTDAFFETISGFTTTGASILTNIEGISKGLLFWRALTHWIGGMGIIVLTVAIIPFLGIGGRQLLDAEVPGIVSDKIHPRIKQSAQRLWGVYVILTCAEIILLCIGGMNFFDSICHSFATMATGGFSTRNASIAAFDSSFIHYVIIFFMFLAGTNFSLLFFAMRGKAGKIFKNEEFLFYVFIVVVSTLLITTVLILKREYSVNLAIRDSLFQVVSIITTTGFVTANYENWSLLVRMFIFILLFVGASSGSTAGAIKMVRIWVIIKNISKEFVKILHPRAIIRVRLDGKVVSPDIVSHTLVFFFLYIFISIVSVLIMIAIGLDLESALGSVAATIGNVGPGIGSVGPIGNYASIPDFGKWLLSFLMLVGRLELLTVLVLFSKAFWKV